MKTVLIGSVVAAIIVFVYQALSWMVLPVHENTLKYTPNQDAILSAITANLTEAGMYAIPNVPPTATEQERQAFQEAMAGQPWVLVQFSPTGMSGSMLPQMVWGFIIDFIAALVLGYVMWTARSAFASFGARVSLALGFAVFTVFQGSLMMANWWETPGHYLSGEIIDHLLGWLLAGVWFGWYFGRKQVPITS